MSEKRYVTRTTEVLERGLNSTRNRRLEVYNNLRKAREVEEQARETAQSLEMELNDIDKSIRALEDGLTSIRRG